MNRVDSTLALEFRSRLIKIVKEEFYLNETTKGSGAMPDKYKTLLDNINGFIVLCDLTTGLYEYVSEGIKSHLGYDLKGYSSESLTNFMFSILEKSHAEFIINYLLPTVMNYFRENATQETISDFRFTCCAKMRNIYDEYEWYLLDTVVIDANDQGLPVRTLITCTNINQFKKGNNVYFNIVKKNNLGIYEVMVEGPDENNKTEYNLTPREVEITNLICQGLTNKQIAHKLHISINTVQTHRKSIMKKSKCSGTAELVNFAFSRGLL